MEKEIWKDIAGYEGLYQVSNFGRVKSRPRRQRGGNQYGAKFYIMTKGKILRLSMVGRGWEQGEGYLSVSLADNKGRHRRRNVHRLVAEAFIPNPMDKPQVNHIDGDKKNNCVKNLEWSTRNENMWHCTHVIKTLHSMYPPIKIRCLETGETYVSISEAARQTGLNRRALSDAVKQNRPYGGYHWEKL